MSEDPGPPGFDQGPSRQSIEALERGELPLEAQARVRRQRETGAWTSDLSVQELAAIHSVGFLPVGQVMGSSVYKLGWLGYYRCGYGWGFTVTELTPYAEGLHAARRLAIDRMREEARQLGAHGVAGVRLRFRAFEEIQGAVEFTAIGTAIAAPGQQAPARPFTSGLDGQGFAKLIRTGFVPCSLVIGVAAVHVHTGWYAQGAQMSWSNIEIVDFSQAVAHTRSLAMSRLQQDAVQHGADGTVGSDIQIGVWGVPCNNTQGGEREDHVVQFVAIGTAVARFGAAPGSEPRMQVRLVDQEV